jgi:predicted nucleic acid-binding protein
MLYAAAQHTLATTRRHHVEQAARLLKHLTTPHLPLLTNAMLYAAAQHTLATKRRHHVEQAARLLKHLTTPHLPPLTNATS